MREEWGASIKRAHVERPPTSEGDQLVGGRVTRLPSRGDWDGGQTGV